VYDPLEKLQNSTTHFLPLSLSRFFTLSLHSTAFCHLRRRRNLDFVQHQLVFPVDVESKAAHSGASSIWG
jgi:hypothetical protein